MREVWNRSTEIAGIAYVLCKHFTRLKPDQASLAGLTHQIGILPILTFAEDHPNILRDGITLNNVIDKIHPAIGEHILKSWDFPEELICVPKNYLNFNRSCGEQADYVDIITVAVIQSYQDSEHPFSQLDCSKIPAFKKLGFEASNDPNDQLNEEMEQAMQLLASNG